MLDDFYPNLTKNLQGITTAIVLAVMNPFHVADVDQPLCTHHTGEVRDEDDLLNGPRAVTVNDSIFL